VCPASSYLLSYNQSSSEWKSDLLRLQSGLLSLLKDTLKLAQAHPATAQAAGLAVMLFLCINRVEKRMWELGAQRGEPGT
jgi:hypothetical protein